LPLGRRLFLVIARLLVVGQQGRAEEHEECEQPGKQGDTGHRRPPALGGNWVSATSRTGLGCIPTPMECQEKNSPKRAHLVSLREEYPSADLATCCVVSLGMAELFKPCMPPSHEARGKQKKVLAKVPLADILFKSPSPCVLHPASRGVRLQTSADRES